MKLFVLCTIRHKYKQINEKSALPIVLWHSSGGLLHVRAVSALPSASPCQSQTSPAKNPPCQSCFATPRADCCTFELFLLCHRLRLVNRRHLQRKIRLANRALALLGRIVLAEAVGFEPTSPVWATAFRVRLVMTTSIRFQRYSISLYFEIIPYM